MKKLISNSENLDDIVFEHRNKEYGAYELRKSYGNRLIKSFFTALILIATMVFIPVLIYQLVKKHVPPKQDFTSEKFDFTQDYVVEKKMELEKPTAKAGTQTNADLPYEAVKDSLLVHEEIIKDTLSNMTSVSTSMSTTNGNADSTQGNVSDTTNANGNNLNAGTNLFASAKPFDLVSVENPPQFHGGEVAMISFLQKNIHYNEYAKRDGIRGKIFASFIINAKGEVEAIKIIRGLGYGLDEEVVRVLGIMPAWEPGYYHGKPVSTILNLPVSFNLIQ